MNDVAEASVQAAIANIHKSSNTPEELLGDAAIAMNDCPSQYICSKRVQHAIKQRPNKEQQSSFFLSHTPPLPWLH
eukprot:18117-Heterococcus_DN1.PRE.2